MLTRYSLWRMVILGRGKLMFRRRPHNIDELLPKLLRAEGMETPLLQLRIIEAWDKVMGKNIGDMTGNKFIKNQTLFVKITSPALKQDLSMMKSRIVKRLNEAVHAQVIMDIHFY